MAQEQQQGTVTVSVPGDLVGRPDAGMIKVQIPNNLPPNMMRDEALRLAKQHADTSTIGVQAPGSGGQQRFGLNLPAGEMGPEAATAMQEMFAAAPQLAAFAAQLFPGVRAFGMAGSAGIPMAARAATNVVEGKPVGQGVIGEGALGAALHMPTTLGNWATGKAEDVMRHNLFSETPLDEITDTMRATLPKKALERRAAATPAGIDRMTREMVPAYDKATDLAGQVKSYTDVGYQPPTELAQAMEQAGIDFDDLRQITNMLKAVEKKGHVRGTGAQLNAVLPGSGPVTTAARAAQLPAAVGQALSPAVAAAKGSPARRMAIARNLHRPGNLVDADTLGLTVSQLARLLAAAGMEPVASHEAVGSGNVQTPSRTPRRRQ